MLFRHSRHTHTFAPCNAARRGHTLKFLRVIYLCIAKKPHRISKHYSCSASGRAGCLRHVVTLSVKLRKMLHHVFWPKQAHFFFCFRVSCAGDVVTKFFTDYDKAVRPDFGKWGWFSIYKKNNNNFPLSWCGARQDLMGGHWGHMAGGPRRLASGDGDYAINSWTRQTKRAFMSG